MSETKSNETQTSQKDFYVEIHGPIMDREDAAAFDKWLKENTLYCSRCDGWGDTPCICYAR